MNSYTRTSIGIVLILIITFCGSFVVSKWTERIGRVDLTEESLYSIGEGTQAILDKLQQELSLKLFYSRRLVDSSGHDQLQAFTNYYYYVRDLLRSYERASGGRVRFEEFDPRAYSDAEEEADRLGIRRIPFTAEEGFYFGLAVTNNSGGKQVEPFLSPYDPTERRTRASTPPLEYKVSEMIDLASRRTLTKLGVLSSLDVTGGGMNDMMRRMMQMQGRPVTEPWGLFQQLGKFYEITDVAADTDEIDPELGYLCVFHPKSLPEKTLYAIDQYVMNGGKLLVVSDPFCYYGDQPPPNPQNQFGGMNHDSSSSLNRLLEAWGVRMAEGEISGDNAFGQPVPAGRRGTLRFAGLMSIDQSGFPANGLITDGLKRSIDVLFGGALEKVDVEGVNYESLLQTTGEGNTITAQSYELRGFQGGPPNFAELQKKFSPGAAPVTLAARVTGTFKSAFPDGAPKADEAENGSDEPNEDEPKEDEAAEDAGADHRAECRDANAVIVFSDVDMLADNMAFIRPFGQVVPRNSSFAMFLNALELAAGSSDLMRVRAKARVDRPFTVVDAIEHDADLATQAKAQEIEAEIQQLQSDMSELRSQATGENVGIVQNEANEKQRGFETKIRDKRRELARVQKAKRDDIESLGSLVWWFNVIWVPVAILAVGVILSIQRRRKNAAAVGGAAA